LSGVLFTVFRKLISRLSYGSRVYGFLTAARNIIIDSPVRTVLSTTLLREVNEAESTSVALAKMHAGSEGSVPNLGRVRVTFPLKHNAHGMERVHLLTTCLH
jgi:hypothetical protein